MQTLKVMSAVCWARGKYSMTVSAAAAAAAAKLASIYSLNPHCPPTTRPDTQKKPWAFGRIMVFKCVSPSARNASPASTARLRPHPVRKTLLSLLSFICSSPLSFCYDRNPRLGYLCSLSVPWKNMRTGLFLFVLYGRVAVVVIRMNRFMIIL